MGQTSELHLQMQDYLMSVYNQVEEGELSNLDGLITLRQNREELEKSLEIIKEFETNRLENIANEAMEYPKGYKGFQITQTNGRKMFSFKGIRDIEEIEERKKETEEKFKSAFEGFQKGTVQTTEEEGVRYWIDADGELKPFPEVNFGKSFITVKKLKQ